MIQITPHMRILLAVQPADFRKGIDGLARLCREQMQSDPFSGCLYVFRNRRATTIRVLTYDLCEVPRYVEMGPASPQSTGVPVDGLHIMRLLRALPTRRAPKRRSSIS